MKKQIIILFCLSVLSFNVFAGKPVSKEPSPLSVLESEEERQSWCESDGYALVNGNNLHYWLYNSYLYHDGDISELVFEIIPKWFQSLEYFVVPDYETVSPNSNLAASVKELMSDFDSDVSITFIKGNNSYDNVIVNSYDSDSNLYTTYIFSGTKVDRAKISSSDESPKTNVSNPSWYEAPELKEWREYLEKTLKEEIRNDYIKMIDDTIANCKKKNYVLNKHDIAAAGYGLKAKYGSRVPDNFKFGGKMSDKKLAETINKVVF